MFRLDQPYEMALLPFKQVQRPIRVKIRKRREGVLFDAFLDSLRQAYAGRGTHQPRRPHSLHCRLLKMRGRLAALLLGLVLVALIEGGLRLIPALDPPAFAIQLARVENRALQHGQPGLCPSLLSPTWPSLSGVASRMTPRPYIEPAPEGALRVLFAGGSTVQGYPHPKRLSAPSYLQEMLGDLFPASQIEVFNAGITAASSFAVARAVEDGTAALGADLVVVYTGHNELYGVYGAASLAQGGQAVWMKRVHYALVQWRLRPLVGQADRAVGQRVVGWAP